MGVRQKRTPPLTPSLPPSSSFSSSSCCSSPGRSQTIVVVAAVRRTRSLPLSPSHSEGQKRCVKTRVKALQDHRGTFRSVFNSDSHSLSTPDPIFLAFSWRGRLFLCGFSAPSRSGLCSKDSEPRHLIIRRTRRLSVLLPGSGFHGFIKPGWVFGRTQRGAK